MPGGGDMAVSTDEIARLAQQCLTACPVLVLGTGGSIPYGVGGMVPLRDYLATKLSTSAIANEPEILELLSLLPAYGLEQALTLKRLSDEHERVVIRHAWEKVYGDDCALYERIVQGTTKPHLEKLFRYLFQSTQRQLNVVTTNYDRLAEYSANSAGFGFFTGFSDGYIGRRSIDESSRTCRYGCTQGARSRTVQIWKVHGSVDWYALSDGRVVCLPTPPSDGHSEPLIVTPGTSKYQRTHAEPFRTVISEADRALRGASALLCVGYGFNDEHIHPKLLERIRDHGKPLVVLARSLTDAAKRAIAAVISPTFLAIECGPADAVSRVYTSSHPSGDNVDLPNLWDLGVFLDTFVLPSGS